MNLNNGDELIKFIGKIIDESSRDYINITNRNIISGDLVQPQYSFYCGSLNGIEMLSNAVLSLLKKKMETYGDY